MRFTVPSTRAIRPRPGGALGVILVDPVVVRTQHDEVLWVGIAPVLPRDDVVHLTLIGRSHAVIPCTDRKLGHSHDALFDASAPLLPIEVHRSADGVKERRQCAVKVYFTGDHLVDILRTRHCRAVGHTQRNFLTITIEDLSQRIQGDKDIGLQSFAWGRAMKEGFLDGFDGTLLIDGVVKLSDDMRRGSNRHCPQRVSPAIHRGAAAV